MIRAIISRPFLFVKQGGRFVTSQASNASNEGTRPRFDQATPSIADRDFLTKEKTSSQFINTIMRDGKKAFAQRILYKALRIIHERTLKDALSVFTQAIERASPLIRMVSTKKGSKSIQVPMALNERQRRRRAIVWILEQAEKRGERKWEERIAGELLAIGGEEGESVVLQKKDQMHRQAVLNRANVQTGTLNQLRRGLRRRR